MNDGFIILSKNVMQARGFFYWVRFSTFYKPSSVKLELKMVYKKFKILSNEKNHFAYSILHISKTGRE